MSDSVWPQRRQPTRLRRPWDSQGKNTGVGCHFLLPCMKVKSESEVTQSCPTLRDPMDCSPPGSTVHEIFQARVLEWGAIAYWPLICKVVVPVYTFITRIAIVPHFNQQLVGFFHFSQSGRWIVISHCGFNVDFLDDWWQWIFCICLFIIYEALIFLLVFLSWVLGVLEISWIWVLCQIYELELSHRNLWDVFSFLLVCLLIQNL